MANNDLKLVAISMIRNEGDLIQAVLNQAAALFDHYIIVDVQSSDGTTELIREFQKSWPHVSLYTFRSQEKYQGALMNALTDKALDMGADWIFYIDGDEFLNVQSRDELQAYMKGFPHGVMHMPWINMVPSEFGTFDHFDPAQDFFWSGRVQPYNKIAVSGAYFAANPGFNIQEGNHHIARDGDMEGIDWQENIGLALLHVPVRSADRLRYKIAKAMATLATKHNAREGEGYHVIRISKLISEGRSNSEGLNVIAANYGINDDKSTSVDVEAMGWPRKRLPSYCYTVPKPADLARNPAETARVDTALEWEPPQFIKGSAVQVVFDGLDMRMSAQPVSFGGKIVRSAYKTLPASPSAPLSPDDFSAAAVGAVVRQLYSAASEHTRLIPFISGLAALLKPRRFIDLGLSHGAIFAAVCQAAADLKIDTQCVAVDTWSAEDHPGLPPAALSDLRAFMALKYPKQHSVQASPKGALSCFEPDSIDLVRFNGRTDKETLLADIEDWLPRMTDQGVVLMTGVTVYENGCEGWQVWEELRERYPSITLPFSGGLGLAWVGAEDSPIAALLREVGADKTRSNALWEISRTLGDRAVDTAESDRRKYELAFELTQRDASLNQAWGRIAELEAEINRGPSAPTAEALVANDCPAGPVSLVDQYATIAASGRFDTNYYLAENEHVRTQGIDPITHYLLEGARQNRNPNSWFNTERFAAENGTVASGHNPFALYLSRPGGAAA